MQNKRFSLLTCYNVRINSKISLVGTLFWLLCRRLSNMSYRQPARRKLSGYRLYYSFNTSAYVAPTHFCTVDTLQFRADAITSLDTPVANNFLAAACAAFCAAFCAASFAAFCAAARSAFTALLISFSMSSFMS